MAATNGVNLEQHTIIAILERWIQWPQSSLNQPKQPQEFFPCGAAEINWERQRPQKAETLKKTSPFFERHDANTFNF